jgi:cytochrome c biogenesis protein CcdA/glutaredoxin
MVGIMSDKTSNKVFLAMFFALIIALPPVSAQSKTTELYIFYGQGCPHCAQAEIFLDDIQRQHPELEVVEKEVYFNNENRKLFESMAAAYGQETESVPTIFIDGKSFVGFSPQIQEAIRQEITRCQLESCAKPSQYNVNTEQKPADSGIIKTEGSPIEDPQKTQLKKNLTIPAVISAAAVDAINPCAFAVLIILLTTILATKSRRRALFAGIAFTASIYISYFLMGLGIYSAINAAKITQSIYIIVAIFAIIIGLFNLKDYLWYGRWFIMEVPQSWRPALKTLIKSVTSIPGAFFVGFVVSLFLLPCTSGPYIVILGLLAETTTRDHAIILLLLYNLIFILPMIIITLAIYLGFTTTEEAEKWRQGRLKHLHLIAGAILLLLGIGMLVAIFFRLI